VSDGQLDLGQVAVGFVAIVVGVFIALAAEAWWQDREEAALERDNLELLAQELVTIDSTLARVVRIDSATTVALGTTLSRIQTRQELTADDFAFNLEDYRIPTGAMRRLLSDPGPALRTGAQLYTGLSDLEAEIDATRDLIRMLTSTTLQDIEGFFEVMAGVSGGASMAEVGDALAGDPRVSAHLQMWLLTLQNRDRIHRELRRMVTDVRRELAAAIGGEAP
jgi:hypothetical protein